MENKNKNNIYVIMKDLDKSIDNLIKENSSLKFEIAKLKNSLKYISDIVIENPRKEELTDEIVEEKEVDTRVAYIKQRNGL